MRRFERIRSLTPVQRNTFIACFLGWLLDAFDFFILVFCVSAIGAEFHVKVSTVAEAIFITLAMRPESFARYLCGARSTTRADAGIRLLVVSP